jgi:microcystin-dependent protein
MYDIKPTAPGDVVMIEGETGQRYVSRVVNGTPATFLPTGTPLPWLLADPPPGFLIMGSVVSRTTYDALFAVVGTQFGAGDGSTTFSAGPSPNGKALVGFDSTQVEFNAIGKTGGEKTHTLTTAELASHNHTQNSHNHTQDAHEHSTYEDTTRSMAPVAGSQSYYVSFLGSHATGATAATNQSAIASNQATGSDLPHNNLAPYLVTNYIIKT